MPGRSGIALQTAEPLLITRPPLLLTTLPVLLRLTEVLGEHRLLAAGVHVHPELRHLPLRDVALEHIGDLDVVLLEPEPDGLTVGAGDLHEVLVVGDRRPGVLTAELPGPEVTLVDQDGFHHRPAAPPED